MSIAACLIVKDGAATLGRCLDSVRPYVDEVCVYDTGSTDGTFELLDELTREPGAPLRLERGEWRDDFAWARQQSFAMASDQAGWAIWIDADDTLVGGENIPTLIVEAETRGAAQIEAVHDHHDRPDGSRHLEWTNRIVPIAEGHWEGRVHELYRVRGYTADAGLSAHPGALRVVHLRRDQRPGHYLEPLRRAAERPDQSPRALFLLGRELMGIGQHAEAADHLWRYVREGHDKIEGDWNGFRAAALLWLTQIYNSSGRIDNARRFATMGKGYVSAFEREAKRGRAPDPEFARWRAEQTPQWLNETAPSLTLAIEERSV